MIHTYSVHLTQQYERQFANPSQLSREPTGQPPAPAGLSGVAADFRYAFEQAKEGPIQQGKSLCGLITSRKSFSTAVLLTNVSPAHRKLYDCTQRQGAKAICHQASRMRLNYSVLYALHRQRCGSARCACGGVSKVVAVQ